MNCLSCNNKLEIFAKNNKEMYACPFCLSGLLLNESSIKVLKYFCTQEIMSQLISSLLDDSLFDNTKRMLAHQGNLFCPKCKSSMQPYDFNKKLRFSVPRCSSCGSIWVTSMQIPLVSIAFLEDNPDDINFKGTINNVYEALARRNAKKIRSFDEMIAPFIAITGLAPAILAGDTVLSKTPPLVTRSFIVTCFVVFLLQTAVKEMLPLFSLITQRVYQGEWYRLITHAFMHGGIVHLAGNMLFLRIFGKSVEDELGWKKYISLFLLGAVVSGIFFMATTSEKDIPCVGASGAISAVIGAYLILFPKAKLKFYILHPLTLQKLASTYVGSFYYIIFWIVMNAFFGMLQSGSKVVGTAHWGHIGGFIAGVIFVEGYKNLKQG